jgi:hypothetical protein
MGQINQYTVKAGEITSLRFDGGSRTVIRCDGNDVRIAYMRDLFGQNQFFTIKDGEAFVFDPSPITGTTRPELGAIIYATVNTGANATVQVWLQGETQGA